MTDEEITAHREVLEPKSSEELILIRKRIGRMNHDGFVADLILAERESALATTRHEESLTVARTGRDFAKRAFIVALGAFIISIAAWLFPRQ